MSGPGFDLENRYVMLSEIDEPLERLVAVIDFEPLRYRLENVAEVRGRIEEMG